MLIASVLRLMIIPLVEEQGVYGFLWCISPECEVLRHIILEQDIAFLYLYLLNVLIFSSAGDLCSSRASSGINHTLSVVSEEDFSIAKLNQAN